MKKIRISSLIAIIFSGFVLSSCDSGNKKDPYLNMAPNKIYNIGHKALVKGSGKKAIDAFELYIS